VSSHPHTALSAQRLRALESEIRRRPPRPAAAGRLRVSAPPIRTCYLTLTRLEGPREAVLDYAAFLFDAEKKQDAPPQPGLAVEAVEAEENGELALLLSAGISLG
jgi:hypothetical protein